MARLIRHEATGPIELPAKPDGKSHWVCACGLSQSMPTCDGSHKKCRTGEESGKLYVYDADRQNVVEARDDN